MRLFLPLLFLCVSAWAQAQESAGTPAHAAEMPGNRLLIVAPATAERQAQKLSALISAAYPFDIRVIDSADYAPLIDEVAHDAFVYLGTAPDTPPPAAFVDDMARTDKPLLWINFHVWLLGEKLLRYRGLYVKWRQDADASSAKSAKPDSGAGSIWVGAQSPARIVNWEFDARGAPSQPATVVAGNLTYLSFVPDFDRALPNAAPLLATALHQAFGTPSIDKPAPSPSFEDRVQRARSDPFATGIHLPVYISQTARGFEGYDSDSLHENLLRIKNAGAEWVTIQRVFYQEGINASQIAEDPARTATLASLKNIVADAHKIGLMVRLIPVVNLTEASRKPNEWRGMIRPSDPDQWWSQYRAIVIEAANFARENEVESLTVGAELAALLGEDDRWLSLIADVRQEANYRGLVSYQINFDTMDLIGWAQALDYLSIAAYWPLAEDRDPKPETLNTSWRTIGEELAAWQLRHPGVKIEFGEIGYVSQPYTSVFPFSWKPHKSQKRYLSEQLACYVALEKFLSQHPAIAGVSFFASTGDDMNPESIGYTPFGKPAGEVMERILKSR